jgi:ketosteroid isomerase-like protein
VDEGATPTKDEEAALRGALRDWVAATNARDIGRQMTFYGPTINAFYRARNATSALVRAEKEHVFRNADTIDIRVAEPQISVAPDGRSATMRFRKSYAIAGGGQDRRGEVIQELRWLLVDGRWRIVSERDLKVVR